MDTKPEAEPIEPKTQDQFEERKKIEEQQRYELEAKQEQLRKAKEDLEATRNNK